MSEKYLGDASEDRVLGAQLDEAVRSQNGIFYYRTDYDARKGSPNFILQTRVVRVSEISEITRSRLNRR